MEPIIFITLFFLISIQSILGVGILVIGTPFMLVMSYDFIFILNILLPTSIFTSLMNIIVIKYSSKPHKFKDERIILKNFFLICAPSMFLGILLLKAFQDKINFGVIVSTIIIFSLFIKLMFQNKFKKILKKYYKWLISLLGSVHGLTNSGGTILLLLIGSIINHKEEKRYIVSIFYFLLAGIQYLIFLFFFRVNLNFDLMMKILIIIPLGIFLGNILIKKINNEVFSNFVNCIIIISAFSLLLKSI